VLQAMLSIVLQRPDEARARPRDYIKNTTQYNSIFGSDLFPLTIYLKTTEICRRVDDFLDAKEDGVNSSAKYLFLPLHVRLLRNDANGHANPGKIQQIDVSALSDEILERCYRRVSKKYEKLAERDAKNGEKDYDSVAKGQVY